MARPRLTGRLGRLLVRAGTSGAVALTAHTIVNLRLLRTPPDDPAAARERVSVLLPVRDEAARIAPCLRALLAQERLTHLEILVLDDGSTDGTADVVRRIAGHDPRLRVLTGRPLPGGWLGKPHACQQLADAATGSVLVYVDADVVLASCGIAATVDLLRSSGLELVCPYPRQLAGSVPERLVQPLLQWSWLTTLPLRLAERSPRASLAAANGQLLAVDTAAYRRAGCHAAVRRDVLDDIALLRAVKRSGGTGAVADGTGVATCRMYGGWADLRDGYSKSLWSAFGSPLGAMAAMGLLAACYVAPAVAALWGSRTGLLGYAAGAAGRALVAHRTGARVLPDVAAHPVSITLLCWLTARSWRVRNTLTWKGRPVVG